LVGCAGKRAQGSSVPTAHVSAAQLLRHVNSILEARNCNFGRLGFVEVGALSVGRIVQVHPPDAVQRGEEKSVFRFGGSAIVVFGEPDMWCPFDDLLKHSREGVETLVRLGESICKRR
jgi:phosphatidylserine decarboxylase